MTVRDLIIALENLDDLDMPVVWGQDEDSVDYIEVQYAFNQVVLYTGNPSAPSETTNQEQASPFPSYEEQ